MGIIFFFLLSCVRLFETPWTVAHQAPPSMGFSRQGYWNGLPFPSPGDLPDPGIEPRSPALEADALTSEPPRKPQHPSFLGEGQNLGLLMNCGFPPWLGLLTGPGFVHWRPKWRGPPVRDLPSFFHKSFWTRKYSFSLGVMEDFKNWDSKDRNQKGKD